MRKLLICSIFLPLAALPAQAFIDYKSPFRAGKLEWFRINPEGGTMEPGTQFLSGSVLRRGGKDVNSPVACTKKCQHIEFADIDAIAAAMKVVPGGAIPKNPLSVAGNRWEVGPDHLVPGGFGVLAYGPFGLEPTGRLVVQGPDGPAAVKVVLIALNETKGTAIFQGYGRACLKDALGRWVSCTAFLLPLPMLIYTTRGTILPTDIKITGKMANPFALTDKAKAVQATFADKLRQGLISQGLSLGTGVISGAGGGGSSSSGGGTSSSGGSTISQPIVLSSTPAPKSAQTQAGAPLSFSGFTMSPIQGRVPITSGFGNRVHPITGGIKFHDGIDFAAPTGTPVLAVASGRIMYQGVMGGYGNTIVIDHGGGYSSLYAHLNDFLVGGVGTSIPAGAPIATVGSTGNSTGPHLHLNIRAGGDGVDVRSGYDIDPNLFIRGL